MLGVLVSPGRERPEHSSNSEAFVVEPSPNLARMSRGRPNVQPSNHAKGQQCNSGDGEQPLLTAHANDFDVASIRRKGRNSVHRSPLWTSSARYNDSCAIIGTGALASEQQCGGWESSGAPALAD
jgi:hypothetical protein